MKEMRIYETLMILHPDIAEDGIESLLGRIEGIIEESGGKITEIDQWGMKKLAYRIAKQPQGYYTLLKYAAYPTIIIELERNLKLWEECLRFLTIKLEDEVDTESLAEMERVHKKPAAPPEKPEEKEDEKPEEKLETEGDKREIAEEAEEGEKEKALEEKSIDDGEEKEKES